GRPAAVLVLPHTPGPARLSAPGGPPPTPPVLDAPAANGVLSARHFANAHATRPSMPQLMTGRYYHQNILGPYLPNRHPREFPFSRPDPSAVLLPDLLRRNGYQTLGASAHWWVVPGTPFGAGFDRLDFVPGDPRRGHADAPAGI